MIHTHLSNIGIVLATDSESILNGTQNAKINGYINTNQIFFHRYPITQFYDSLATENLKQP